MFDSTQNPPAELTDRQAQVLDVVRAHLARHGYPPTVREIGDIIGVASSSTVHAHLAALERAGVIQRDPTKPRALKLSQPYAVPDSAPVPDDAVEVNAMPRIGSSQEHAAEPVVAAQHAQAQVLPVLGNVAAGVPMLAEEQVDEFVAAPTSLVRSGASFVLRISGDSMRDAGIFDGDLVVVRRQNVAENGQIVIALVDDEATCKRYFTRNGRVELEPANPDFSTIVPAECRLLGIVTGLMRTL